MNNLKNYFISIDDYIFCPPILALIKTKLNCEQAVIYKLDKERELENIIYASGAQNRFSHQNFLEEIQHDSINKMLFNLNHKKSDLEINEIEEETMPLTKTELITPIYVKTPEIIELNNQLSLWGLLVVYDYNYLREWTTAERKFVENIVQEITLAIERNIIYKKFKQLEKIVQSEQIFDEQTGLTNYTYFLDCLDYEWRNLTREKKLLSLILLEINHPITREIANRVKNQAQRPADVVVGHSHNQILIMLPGTDNSGALCVNEKVIEKIENFHQDNNQLQCRGSIVTCFPSPKQNYEWLLQTVEVPFRQDLVWQGNIYNQLMI